MNKSGSNTNTTMKFTFFVNQFCINQTGFSTYKIRILFFEFKWNETCFKTNPSIIYVFF